MADEQYLTALQPFVILAKSATGRAAADLVMQATLAPNCFVFSELLCMPNIQSLANDASGVRYLNLLKIFAYGSYTDYKANSANLPPLTDRHLQKLKQLSLITLSSKGSHHLTYKSLMHTLDIPSVRALEDLAISAIYASLLSAKLDTKAARVEVSSTAGRDVAPEEVQGMVEILGEWCGRCEGVLADIDEQVEVIRREAVERKRVADEYERLVTVKREIVKGEEGKTAVGGGGGGVGVGATTVVGGGGAGAAGKGKRVISEGDGGSGSRGGWAEEDLMDLDDNALFGGEAGGANTSKRRSKKGSGSLLGSSARPRR